MTSKTKLSLELEAILYKLSIFESEGYLSNKNLEKSINTLKKGKEESSRKTSLILYSNLDSFLHICHILNESSFLRQSGEAVFGKVQQLTVSAQETFETLLEDDIQARRNCLIAQKQEEYLRFADCQIREFQKNKRIIKALLSKKELEMRDVMTIKQIVNRLIEWKSYKSMLAYESEAQVVFNMVQFSKFVMEEAKFLQESMLTLLMKVCFKGSHEISASSLRKIEIMIELSCRIGSKSKIHEYFNDILDFKEV